MGLSILTADFFNLDIGLLVSAPGKGFKVTVGRIRSQAIGNEAMIGAIYEYPGVQKKFEFLLNLLVLACKMLIMGGADAGKDPDGGMDDGFETLHLPGPGDTCFKVQGCDRQTSSKQKVPPLSGSCSFSDCG